MTVDSCKPHQREASIKMANERCNSEVTITPGGYSSIVQPMDKCINTLFEHHMHSMALKMTWYLMTYLLWIKSQMIKRVRVMMREIHVLLLMMMLMK